MTAVQKPLNVIFDNAAQLDISLRLSHFFRFLAPAVRTVYTLHEVGLSEPIWSVAKIDGDTGIIRSIRFIGIRELAAAGRRKASGGGEV